MSSRGNSPANPRRLRRSTFRRDDFTCGVCGLRVEPPEGWNGENLPPLTLGHIIPRAWGGSNRVENIRPECQGCNEGRADSLPILALIEQGSDA